MDRLELALEMRRDVAGEEFEAAIRRFRARPFVRQAENAADAARALDDRLDRLHDVVRRTDQRRTSFGLVLERPRAGEQAGARGRRILRVARVGALLVTFFD